MGRTGTQIAAALAGKTGGAREAVIWGALASDEVPSWIGPNKEHWPEITLRGKDAKGADHTLVIDVAPRQVELGTDADPYVVPMTPEVAQRYATRRKALLPSRKLVDALFLAAAPARRIVIAPPPGYAGIEKSSSAAYTAHNAILQKVLGSSKRLVEGGKKNVVVGPEMTGEKVAIYSAPFNASLPLRPVTGGVYGHQPYSTIHGRDYIDYSHGVRLVRRVAQLDGKDVDLVDIFKSPTLHVLVSDQGPFVPVFPEPGKGIAPASRGTSARVADSAPAINPPPRAVRVSPRVLKAGTAIGAGLGVLGGVLLGYSWPWRIGLGAAGAGAGYFWTE